MSFKARFAKRKKSGAGNNEFDYDDIVVVPERNSSLHHSYGVDQEDPSPISVYDEVTIAARKAFEEGDLLELRWALNV
jgi:hypothetical protein